MKNYEDLICSTIRAFGECGFAVDNVKAIITSGDAGTAACVDIDFVILADLDPIPDGCSEPQKKDGDS